MRPPIERALAWTQAIEHPQLCLQWNDTEWERVIRLSRRLRLLGRLAEAIAAAGLVDALPEPVARHLLAEQRYSRWRTGSLLWLLDRLTVMLEPTPYPLVLLKGAAYIGQDLPIASGRIPSDADILVPRAFIDDARQRLVQTGWIEAALDDHDRRYYTEWSHELPPLRHAAFGLELDLHHNILPPLARTPIDADLLLARLRPSKWPAWQVLHPVDQVLHSAAHLFHDSDCRDRLRDLVDLDGLMRHFGREPGFWSALPDRARELGLGESMAMASHYCAVWLGTPIPPDVQAQLRDSGPRRGRRAALQAIFTPLLTPTEPDAGPSMAQAAAARMLLVKYHLWRLPLRLLVPHAWHKLRTRPLRRQGSGQAPDHQA